MDWAEIRAHYARLVARAGATQHAIAERGGLKGQGTISKLLANTHLGPSVETFVRAVIGTGTEVSAFFAAIERRAGPAPISVVEDGAPARSEIAQLHEFELACQALMALLASWSSAAAAAHRDGGADGEQSPPSESDRSSTPSAELELRRVEAIVQASTARILADIALLEQRMAPGSGRSAVVPTGAPRP